MKYIFYLIIAATMIGCTKESQEDDDQINNTNNTNDPCAGINCQNGGVCVNGDCNCPDGYTGTFCQTQLPTQTMTITAIRVENFQSTDNGSNWDLLGGPDLMLSGNIGNNADQTQFISGVFTDADIANNYTFDNLNWTFKSNTNVTIGLWDADSPDSDDFMGGIYFLPQAYDDGFPEEILLQVNSVTFRLFVNWTY